MAKQGKFIHQGEFVSSGTNIGNAYNTGVPVPPNQSQFYNEVLTGKLSYLLVRGDTRAGSPLPAKVTAYITEDAAGDKILVPETEMTLTLGKTAAGTWAGAARLDVDVRIKAPVTNLYVWCKTDSGTASLEEVFLTWEE